MSKEESYIFGLLITDGSMYLSSRNRGRVILELNKRDEDIIIKLSELIPNSRVRYRTRDTNFKTGYQSAAFCNFRLEFRTWLINCGYPIFDKTNNACCPCVDYDEIWFWRGVIDGDGSLGFTKDGRPFISLVTKSEYLKIGYLDFIERTINLLKHPTRNKRDGVYNITMFSENAKTLTNLLYLGSETNELSINRKYEMAKNIKAWERKT